MSFWHLPWKAMHPRYNPFDAAAVRPRAASPRINSTSQSVPATTHVSKMISGAPVSICIAPASAAKAKARGWKMAGVDQMDFMVSHALTRHGHEAL